MKRNFNRLIAQIDSGLSKTATGRFKITCKNVNQYTNKILVDSKQYNQPSQAQKIVEAEMQEYKAVQDNKQTRFYPFTQRTSKPLNLQQEIIRLEGCLSLLVMQDVMAALRVAKREELVDVRPKLIKLKNNLSFKLQSLELEPHMQQPLSNFLQELAYVINKASKVF